MPTASPRDIVLSGIIVLVSMSFLAGVFLMFGLQKWLQGDPLYLATLVLMPLLALAVGLHIRRMLKAVQM